MNNERLPGVEHYWSPGPVDLDMECAELFVDILSSDCSLSSIKVDNQTQRYYTSELFEPYTAHYGKGDAPSLRISQVLAVAVPDEIGYEINSHSQTKTSNEYRVYSLETRQSITDTLDDHNLDQPWQGLYAAVIKPATQESKFEVHLLDQQTGDDLTDAEKINLLSILLAWQHEQRQLNFNDTIYSDDFVPAISNRQDPQYVQDLQPSFLPADYIADVSCQKCSLQQIPCSHRGFRHNLN